MKTILVPFDFSPASENALAYANNLAVRLPAEVVLVQGGAGKDLPAEQRAAALEQLGALAERLRFRQVSRHRGRRIKYCYHLAAEPLDEALPPLVACYKADLVVTGLGLTDGTAVTAAGPAGSLLPRGLQCPLLLVPPGEHELPTYVVVCGDFAHCHGHHLAGLPALARSSTTHFDLLQFQPPTSTGLVSLKKTLLTARAYLPSAAVNLLVKEDELEGISAYCAQQSAELLVVANPQTDLLSRFFNPLSTKASPYHLCIPVLLLPPSHTPVETAWAQSHHYRIPEAELQDVSMETL